MDWEDLSKAPVWDSMYGFGGNGNISAQKSVSHGHCVTDGPFANFEALYFGDQIRKYKHCLSRGFLPYSEAQKFTQFNSPDFIEETLGLTEYEEFYMKLEYDSHNALPQFIRGEFYQFTSPNGNYALMFSRNI